MGEEGFRSAIKSLIHFSIARCNGKKISPCYQQNVSTLYFFPKMNTTVKIHRAQRIHICSTRYTLYKLDMYNSTECLNPCGSPTTKSVSNGQDCESERQNTWSSVPSSTADLVQCTSVHTGTAKMKIKARVESDYPANLFFNSFNFQLIHTLMVTQGLPPPVMDS